MHLRFFVWWAILLFAGAMPACRRSDFAHPTPVEPPASAEPPASLPATVQPQSETPSRDATATAEPTLPPDPIETMTVPADPVAKARLYFENGYGQAAFQVLSALPDQDRKKPENRLLEGLSAEMCGRFREAASACADAEALPADKGRIDALLCQGRVWMQLKDFKVALQKFQDAYAAAPRDTATALSLMDALATLDDGAGLLRLTKKMLEADPGNAAAQLYLGIALEMTGQRDEADAAFGKLAGNDAVPAYLEASAFDLRGQLWAKITPERAKGILEECLKRFPSYGCPRTEVAISPPDPRHPNRKIRNVIRPGRYGTEPLPSPPP